MNRKFCKQAVKDIRWAMNHSDFSVYSRAVNELKVFWPVRNKEAA